MDSGTRYAIGSVVFYGIDNDIPVFGKIKDIIVLGHNDHLFVLIPYVGNWFSSHFNAYEVQCHPNQIILCGQKELVDYHALSFSKSFSPSLSHKLYVSLKYHVFV